jgi:hypothetical protein
MLAYLEELCTALLAHDAIAVHRLLADPLARSLPRQVREEAIAISRANPSSLRAPIQTLRFYHQTLQLGESDAGPDATGTESGDAEADAHLGRIPAETSPPITASRDLVIGDGPREQIELPLACGDAVAA